MRLKKGNSLIFESEIGIPSQYRFCQVLEWNRSFTVSAILSACNATIFNSFLEKLVKKEKKFLSHFRRLYQTCLQGALFDKKGQRALNRTLINN